MSWTARLYLLGGTILAASVATATPSNVLVQRLRGPLDVVGVAEPFALSRAEVRRLRDVSGRIRCPGLPRLSTGAEAEAYVFGTEREQFILTTARALIGDDGSPREPLSDCTFVSHGADRTPVPLARVVNPFNYGFGGFDNVAHPENDYAVVRLARPLRAVEPLRFAARPFPLAGLDESRLFTLTIAADDLVLQNCATSGTVPGGRKHPAVAIHDCKLAAPETSGLAFVRDAGVLVPVALIVGPRLMLGLDDRLLDLAERVMGVSF